jgi:hypothetical protein
MNLFLCNGNSEIVKFRAMRASFVDVMGMYITLMPSTQEWYAYGWEIQLCETGFLAIFLCPLLDPRPFPSLPPPTVVIYLFRWLIMRIMLGAGLIKIRGDPCWRDLTCLVYHYETQVRFPCFSLYLL